MEDRQDVTAAHDTVYEPENEGHERLTPAKRAVLGLILMLGATLTYLELYHRFSS